MRSHCLFWIIAATSIAIPFSANAADVRVRGEVKNASTDKPIACRIYVQHENGTWHFPESEAKTGTAITYKKQRGEKSKSVEMHTTLSAHPFHVTLPPGRYTFTVESGKEYL